MDPSVTIHNEETRKKGRRLVKGLFIFCLVMSVPLAYSLTPAGYTSAPGFLGFGLGRLAGIIGMPAILAAMFFGGHHLLVWIRVAKRDYIIPYRAYFVVLWILITGMILLGHCGRS